MSITLDHTAPPGTDPADTAFLERLHALEQTAVRLAADRDRALLLAALIARSARAVRRDRDRLLGVNFALQAQLDHATAPVETPRRGRRHRRH